MHHAPTCPRKQCQNCSPVSPLCAQALWCALWQLVKISQVIYTDQRSQSMLSSTSSKIMRCFGVNFVFVFACFLASWCWRCWLLTILSLYHFSTSGVETFFGTSIIPYKPRFRWIWHVHSNVTVSILAYGFWKWLFLRGLSLCLGRIDSIVPDVCLHSQAALHDPKP